MTGVQTCALPISQPAALYLRAGHTEVTLEDAFMIPRVDAPSEILHIKLYPVGVFLLYSDYNAAVLVGIADCVAQEIGEYPGYLLAVDIQFGDFLCRIVHLNVDVELVRLYLIGFYRIFNQFYRPGDVRLELEHSALHLCHVEQFTGYAQKPFAVLPYAVRQFLLLRVQTADAVVREQLQAH